MIDRRRLFETVRRSFPQANAVCHLGDSSNEMFEYADSDRVFYLLGSMGSALSFALGLSLASNQKTIVFEGDGGALMSLGSLATAARYGGSNLVIIILDNGSYGSTGGQPTAARSETRLNEVARACGFQRSFRCDNDLDSLVAEISQPGPSVIVVETSIGSKKSDFIPISPEQIIGSAQGLIDI
ncbi:thiamine pyrophosphate-dependent enzyme [Arthrobacter sp. UYEF3]|uniref:thiamine pyrophosphate-dependent enzyme n=1 Tax=Arthrobacter sp. UYEF3 TaxID=1756365 RepID=UPI0033949A0B